MRSSGLTSLPTRRFRSEKSLKVVQFGSGNQIARKSISLRAAIDRDHLVAGVGRGGAAVRTQAAQ